MKKIIKECEFCKDIVSQRIGLDWKSEKEYYTLNKTASRILYDFADIYLIPWRKDESTRVIICWECMQKIMNYKEFKRV